MSVFEITFKFVRPSVLFKGKTIDFNDKLESLMTNLTICR